MTRKIGIFSFSYVIKNADGKMYYIPAIPSVVAETDVEGGVMKITPLEGLFDDAEEVR